MTSGGRLPDEVRAIERAIEALEQQRSVLGDAVVDTALRPLEDRREQLLRQPGERRKQVTVILSDLVDSTPITASLGAETMRDVMHTYFAEWRAAIEAEGGVVEKFIGDAVVGVFGMARSREDDPHRAVRAALAVQAPLARLADEVQREHGVDLRTRVGIDTGEVVLGSLGERGDGDIVVVGESVNCAARLQAAAPPDGILLSSATARHVRGSFGLQRAAELSLKGIERPVQTYLVHAAGTPGFWLGSRGIEGVRTRTVGRDVELHLLRKAFSDVAAERVGAVVTVLGEAGIGKSRLLAEFEGWLAGLPHFAWVLRGRADPGDGSAPYGLLRSAFAERLEILETDDPQAVHAKWRAGLADLARGRASGHSDPGDWLDRRAAEAIATWLGFAIGDAAELEVWRQDPQGLQRRARKALGDLFGRMSGQAPVVLLLEDLHWADATTLDWVQDLQAAPQSYPLLVLATARPALLERRPGWGEGLVGHRQIRLEPLSRRESQELVADVLQRVRHLPEWLTALVVQGGEGNPFFIEELVAWLVEQGAIRTDPDGWTAVDEAVEDIAVPGTLRGLLEARLDALEADERDLTDRASVIGRVFWDRAVVRLAGPGTSTSPEVFQRLRTREVVHLRPTSSFEDAQEFTFRHALLRDVAYDGLLRPRRRAYHARAAEWMQEAVRASGRADEHAATVAHHLAKAGQGEAAAEWFLRAGRHAAGSYAGDEALDLFGQALQAAPAGDDTFGFEVLAEQERVLDRLGRRELQRTVLDQLAAGAGDDPARRARALTAHGRWLFFHARYADAVAVAGEAAALGQRAREVDLELEALVLKGRSLAFQGEHLQARGHLERVLTRAREAGARRQAAETLRLLGVVATNLHEDAVAVEVLEEAAEEFRQLSDLEGEALVTGQLGAVLLLTGRHGEARAKSEEALAIFTATAHRLRQGIVMGNLTAIALDLGELDEALHLGRRTHELTEAVDDPEGVVSSLLRLGEIERVAGDLPAARSRLELMVLLGGEHELHYFVAFAWQLLALIDVAEGALAEAWTAADNGAAAAERSEVPATIARAAQVQGLVAGARGDHGVAVERLRAAVTRHAALGMAADTRECTASLAGALLDAGQTTEAGALAREVAATVSAERPEPPGGLEPGLTLVECHRVLAAVRDPDAARVARAAHRFLDDRAALIRDPALRERFLSTGTSRRLAAIPVDAR